MCNNSKDFYNSQEDKDILLLRKCNSLFGWGFNDIKEFRRGNEVDAKVTKDGKKYTLELKERDGNINDFFRYGDVFIEPSKMSYFVKIMESGYTLGEKVLYVNFCNDGVFIYDHDNIHMMKVYPNHRHYNKGKGKYEYETRFGLFVEDAKIYYYNKN